MPDRDPATRPLAGVFGLIARFRREIHELGKFGIIGAIAWVVDTAVFKACLDANANQYLAAVISTLVSATVAFLGNRFWTWRDRRGSSLHREYVLYAFFNAIGLFIAIGCLLVNDKVLGALWPSVFHTQLASIVAKNGVGLVLGTTFRFWSYKRFVFPKQVHPAAAEAAAHPATAEADLVAIVEEEPEAAPGPVAAGCERAPAADPTPSGGGTIGTSANGVGANAGAGANGAGTNGAGPNGASPNGAKANGAGPMRPRPLPEPAGLDD